MAKKRQEFDPKAAQMALSAKDMAHVDPHIFDDLRATIIKLDVICWYCHTVIVIDPRPQWGGARWHDGERMFCCKQCNSDYHHLSENDQLCAKMLVNELWRASRILCGDPELADVSPKLSHERRRGIVIEVTQKRKAVKHAK